MWIYHIPIEKNSICLLYIKGKISLLPQIHQIFIQILFSELKIHLEDNKNCQRKTLDNSKEEKCYASRLNKMTIELEPTLAMKDDIDHTTLKNAQHEIQNFRKY